jgi:glycosyltransferase involved in cell wall biosynthesis
MPTVASNVTPYSEAIEHEKTGFLCSTMSEWIDAIESCLVDERLRRGMIENAREKIRTSFDIKNTAKTWRDILVGDRKPANI